MDQYMDVLTLKLKTTVSTVQPKIIVVYILDQFMDVLTQKPKITVINVQKMMDLVNIIHPDALIQQLQITVQSAIKIMDHVNIQILIGVLILEANAFYLSTLSTKTFIKDQHATIKAQVP